MTDMPIDIDLGKHGLYYGTSPEMKGLLVIGHSPAQVMERAPKAIEEIRECARLARLRKETPMHRDERNEPERRR